MGTRPLSRRIAGCILPILLVALAACSSAPTGGSSRSSTPPAGTSGSPAPSPASASGSPGPSPISEPPPTGTPSAPASTAGAVRIGAPGHGSLLLRGRYPHAASRCVRPPSRSFRARYPGNLRIVRSEDGTLSLTLTLPFERYLEGIAEVPPSWPTAALQAQAIAARSYALATTGWSGSQGQTLRTPICATTSCQVYRGIPVPPQPDVRRWYRAVRSTSGLVLLYQGRPAETVYFSTSNGHTYGNEQVFGSAPLPYLRPVVERDDGASPTSHWRVRIPFSDLTRFLREGGTWTAHRRVARIQSQGSTIVLSAGQSSRSLDLDSFRGIVDAWAPCLEPAHYPTDSLPVTIPSHWVRVSSTRGAAVFTGRGWGHGVGMVQWGAYGKARRGFSASQILAYYYGGLRPQPYPEPGLIHVRVASGLASLRVTPSGPGGRLDGSPLEPGRRVIVTGGDRLQVSTVP